MEESAKVLTGCVDCCSSLIVSSVVTSGSSGSSTIYGVCRSVGVLGVILESHEYVNWSFINPVVKTHKSRYI